MTSPYEENVKLKIGDTAPPFSLPSHPSGTVSLEDFHNKKNVILAFYPKDNTPGCTKEMCTFSSKLTDFEKHETVVLGISTDNEDSHARFANAHGLKQKLLSDSTREVGQAYGAVRGDRYSADRILFVIDKSGIIRHIHDGMPDYDRLLTIVKVLEDMQNEA